MDCKATVKIGEFSRGGLSRGNNKALDHDFSDKGSHTPCVLWMRIQVSCTLIWGALIKTSDFIIDTLQGWWNNQSMDERKRIDIIQLKMDNGPESSGVRTQFLKRIVEFTDMIGKPMQLLYFPPYHSKYNPIERWLGSSRITLEWYITQ